MSGTHTPGVVVNMLRKNGAVRDVRRMAGVEKAADLVGGQARLAETIGMNPGLLRQKIAAKRPIRDDELLLIAAALSQHAKRTAEFAEHLTSLIADQRDS